MTTLAIILVILWLAGVAVTWTKVRKWDNKVYEKAVAALLWPLTLILYVIHFLHNEV